MAPTTQKGFRLPNDLIDRIEGHRLAVEKETGLKVAEAQIVIALLTQALDAAEAKAGRSRRK